MRNKNNLHKHELTGLTVKVVQSGDGGMIGMEGTVVDETRETLVIEEGKQRTIPKRGMVFEFTLDDGSSVTVRGDDIAFRAEDRVKRANDHRNQRGRNSRR
jgi:ribonuclease P protein subunit POP4